MTADPTCNVLYTFFHLPQETHQKLALITAKESLTYGEIFMRMGQIQAWLQAQNLKAQDRVILAIPPSVELYVLLLALIGLNIAAVFIDPGFTPRQMAHCIQSSGGKMVIGRRKAGLLKMLFSECRGIRFIGTDGGIWPWVERLKVPPSYTSPILTPCLPDDHCIITFTSGTTGANKAADRTHGLVLRQLNAIMKRESKTPPSVWMSTFPVTALYCFSRGVTFCFPNVDLRKQRTADPHKIAAQLDTAGIDGITASPAFFHALATKPLQYPSVREVFVGGACVSQKLVTKIQGMFPNMARLVIVYGATEIEPVCLQNGLTLHNRNDQGANVGPILPEIQFYLVDTDRLDADIELGRPIELAAYSVPEGHPGELVLIAPHLMDRYLTTSEQAAKVTDAVGTRWHRMGDMGYLNRHHELVLVGRKKDRIRIKGVLLHPYPIEMALANLEGIHMAAVVNTPELGVGVVIQPEVSRTYDPRALAKTLEKFGLHACQNDRDAATHDRSMSPIFVRMTPEMPVDVRHNSRVDRTQLIQYISKTKPVQFERKHT